MKFGRIVPEVNTQYASIDGVEFSVLCHTFKLADMASFRAEKRCHLVSAYAASTRRICSSVRQFLFRSTFVRVPMNCLLQFNRVFQ